MELHALEGVLAMAQAHDDAVVGPGRDLETLGDRVARHDRASGSAWP